MRTGKIVVATTMEEVDKLECLSKRGQDNNVKGLSILSKHEVTKL